MDDEFGDSTHSIRPQHRLTYPLHKIVAAVGRSDSDVVVAALGDAGFSRDRIEIITADEVKGLGDPIGGSGLRRLLVTFELRLGDDFDELEAAHQELMSGHALIQIRVDGHEEQARVHAILRQHGGHNMHYFGRWTITPLIENEAKVEDLDSSSGATGMSIS